MAESVDNTSEVNVTVQIENQPTIVRESGADVRSSLEEGASKSAQSEKDVKGPPTTDNSAEIDPNTGWLPLESNPDVVNPFSHKMGLPSCWNFTDVFGLEDWAYDMVPKPVSAVVLLFASSQAASNFKMKQFKQIQENGQEIDEGLWYTKQVDGIGNACGTIAIMHCLLNAGNHFQLLPSALTSFATKVVKLDANSRGKALLMAKGLREVSDATAASDEASTSCPEANQATNAHFIAFVEKSGFLYELDGRKAFPINHGPTTAQTLLSDAGKVIRRDFMNVNPTEVRFNIMALAKNA